MRKITLAYPCYRGQVSDFHVPAYEMLRQGIEKSGKFQLHAFARVDCSSVAHARNLLVHQALQQESDWILMQDADTFCGTNEDPHPAITMLREADPEAAAVGAGVMLRDGSRRINVVREAEYLTAPDNQIAPCKSVGAAFFAVNLMWLRRHWPKGPWFQDVLSYDDVPRRKSEDIYFCETLLSKGGKLLADTRFQPHHEGA